MQNTKEKKTGLEKFIDRLVPYISAYPLKTKKIDAMRAAYVHSLHIARDIKAQETRKAYVEESEGKHIYFTAVYIGTNSNQGFVTGTCYKLKMPKFGGMDVTNDAGNTYIYNSISEFLHDWKDVSSITEDKDRY